MIAAAWWRSCSAIWWKPRLGDLVKQIRIALRDTCLSESLLEDALSDLGTEKPLIAKGKHFKPAAVLLCIVDSEKPTLVLTERAATLRNHAGEISLPGGKAEADDDDLTYTALREANEEIGLSQGSVEIIGYLGPRVTLTGFLIQPVVGVVKEAPEWILDKNEVSALHEVDLAKVMKLSNFESSSIEVAGQQRQFYQIVLDEKRVWGATAGIVHSLASLL